MRLINIFQGQLKWIISLFLLLIASLSCQSTKKITHLEKLLIYEEGRVAGVIIDQNSALEFPPRFRLNHYEPKIIETHSKNENTVRIVLEEGGWFKNKVAISIWRKESNLLKLEDDLESYVGVIRINEDIEMPFCNENIILIDDQYSGEMKSFCINENTQLAVLMYDYSIWRYTVVLKIELNKVGFGNRGATDPQNKKSQTLVNEIRDQIVEGIEMDKTHFNKLIKANSN